jgi:adenylate cyclase
VVLVDIDEDSLARFGQWPWPRYRVARLLAALGGAGASAVGLDMVFPEPDRTSLSTLSRDLSRDLGASLPVAGMPEEAVHPDRALARILSRGPFVLGYQFDFAAPRGDDSLLHPVPAALLSRGDGDPLAALFEARGVVANLPELSRAASSSGFFNVVPDPDGVLRRVPVLVRRGGRAYPSLALATYLRARGGELLLRGRGDGLELLLDGRPIPLDRRGNLLVNFRGGRGTFPRIGASSVLDGTVPPRSLEGRIVLVGTTAAGLQEIRTTPVSAAHPGPEIHANVIDDLVAGDPNREPSGGAPLSFLLVLSAGAASTLLLARAGALVGIPLLGLSVAAAWAGSRWLLSAGGVFVSPVLPTAALVATALLVTALRFRRAERELVERTRRLALTQDAIIQSLAALAETRHHETGGHIQRTREYVRILALRLLRHPRFRHFLDEAMADTLYRLAPLHDIGKVGVPDAILLKPKVLSAEEFEVMKKHTLYGSDTIRLAKGLLGDDEFLRIAEEIVVTHQEKWDGTGYPRGLSGEEIPIPGRIMAVADVYDALISPRGYKAAFSHEEATRILVEGKGRHFDPDVVDAYLAEQARFRAVAERFAVGEGVEPEVPGGR